MSGKRWLVFAAFTCGVVFNTGAAHAEDRAVLTRLKRFGDLRTAEARRVIKRVNERMAKSADNFAPENDPLRVAVSRALFGSDTPPNAMQGAKVRLRLFAGINTWALEALFKPVSGQIGNCQTTFSLDADECAALVAAGGQLSLADARSQAAGGGADQSPFGGSAPSVAPVRSTGAVAVPAARVAPPRGRFARYDSGYRGKDNARPSRPVAAPARSAPVVAQPAQPRPMPQARPQVAASTQASTKAAYKARREAYLARQKARLEEQRKKRNGAMASAQPAKSAAADDESGADLGGLSDADGPSASAAAPKKAEKKAEQPLSDDFLNSLLD